MVPKYGTGGYNIIYELGRRDDSTYKNREEIDRIISYFME